MKLNFDSRESSEVPPSPPTTHAWLHRHALPWLNGTGMDFQPPLGYGVFLNLRACLGPAFIAGRGGQNCVSLGAGTQTHRHFIQGANYSKTDCTLPHVGP